MIHLPGTSDILSLLGLEFSMSPTSAEGTKCTSEGLDSTVCESFMVGELGDSSTFFSGLKGKKHFTQIDLASGFHQVYIAEADRHK